ncbi:MAG: hypothetical protein H8D97_00745 [Proteobacteria bacterium]|nr:hypothetical protein [Pseudomonadota bacterium]
MAINSGVLGKLKKYNSIRQRQVTLPVGKIRAITSPLTVRDDLSLRTMVVSPDVYDKILSELIYRHTEFIDMVLPNGDTFVFENKPTSEQFHAMVSEFDKRSLLWGVYASTYESFGKQEINCPSCKDKWNDTITAEQIIAADSFQIWNEDKNFVEYVYPVDIKLKGNSEIDKFRFNCFVPAIKDHLNVLRLVSSEKMKDNFDKFGKILSSSEELSLITKSIELFSPSGEVDLSKTVQQEANGETANHPFAKAEEDVKKEAERTSDEIIVGLYDVYKVINEFIPLNVVDQVAKAYDEKFKKYIPTFKKPMRCRQCSYEFDFPVDVELALFRSFLRL